ncbi:hypothetical protein ABW19_dt0204956 [Dactylella cylindrospora]|nr:hypothetical protein ABW19_dt0204956 [Dactylella cylindrospora]
MGTMRKRQDHTPASKPEISTTGREQKQKTLCSSTISTVPFRPFCFVSGRSSLAWFDPNPPMPSHRTLHAADQAHDCHQRLSEKLKIRMPFRGAFDGTSSIKVPTGWERECNGVSTQLCMLNLMSYFFFFFFL